MIHVWCDGTRTRTLCGCSAHAALGSVREAEVRSLCGEDICERCMDESWVERCMLWTWHLREQLLWN